MEGGRGGGREGGLNVQVTQRSNNCGEKAHNGDKIAMHYTGRLKTTGKVIIRQDSHALHRTFENDR